MDIYNKLYKIYNIYKIFKIHFKLWGNINKVMNLNLNILLKKY